MFMERFYVVSILGVLLIQSFMFWLAVASSNFTDQSALLAFKSEINFDPTSTVLGTNWTKTANFCNWIGVTCSRRRQRVTALHLPYMGLRGTISPHVGNLSFLVSLVLANNSFYGHLPYELGHLRRLRTLILQVNQLEGVIPLSLHHCRKLELMSLAWNSLSGGIPEELGTLPKLRALFLNRNHLTGTIPLSLGNISTLQTLKAPENRLTGSFPLIIFNISSIQSINLGDNSLSGILPTDICLNCPKLEELFLLNNQFTGEIPSTIYQCRELRSLSLTNNRFYGRIPKELGSLHKLEMLYVTGNNFNGTIPPSLGNISSLEDFSLNRNNIHGSIPNELGHLSNLSVLNLQHNHLTGEIPQSIFNISTLRILALLNNTLSGNLPSSTGLRLPNLERVYLAFNQLGGNFPVYLLNCSKLVLLDLGYNLFIGPIPTSLGNLQHLRFLSLPFNRLTGDPETHELSFLTALTNCKLLEKLDIQYNPLGGILPDSVGNLSTSLQLFIAGGCQIKGSIPRTIGSLRKLNLLVLDNNNLNGTIPSTIGGLESLQRLFLGNNQIEGFIPDELCNLRNLGELALQNNKFSGSIPNCIGNLSHLQELYLSSNVLISSIPMSLWSLENLLFLNLSFNSLSGYIPSDMRMFNVMENMDLSYNQISGDIPSTIGDFTSLGSLKLSRNSFQGPIPQSFGDLVSLEFMDLSYNNLSGSIPKSLEALLYLKYLNLSFNKLSGEIPNGGPFANFTAQSFLENGELCGDPILQVRPCSNHNRRKSTTKQILLKYVLPVIATAVIFVSLFYMLRRYPINNMQAPNIFGLLPTSEHKLITYQELRLATNNFSEANLLGVGSFGSVYKGTLFDGTTVAIKVLNLQVEGAFKSFDAECKVLRMVRHRNLVKIISSCSNPELRALIMQYMSKGSLEKWLYSDNYCCLDLVQRISVMTDVATALEYLHYGQSEPVVHCDLKPSNVLLDENMIAHVGDFGISKILAQSNDAIQTKTLGTIGYIAPEYGSEGRVSTRGDIYSYGIMLLEIITKRKPTDEMFSGEVSLRQWVSASLPNALLEVVDGGLLTLDDDEEAGNVDIAIQGCVLSIMELGLECCREIPEERIDIKDVVIKLNRIKLSFIAATAHQM